MVSRIVRGVLVAGLILLAGRVLADDPEPETAPAPQPVAPETLPQPREVLPEVPPPAFGSPFPPYQRVNRYDVWKYAQVDRQGYFRPRVIYGPAGAYYAINGSPYLYSITHQMDWMPYADGTPYPPWPAPSYGPYHLPKP